MDMNKKPYYGKLIISGIADTPIIHGSMAVIMIRVAETLKNTQPRRTGLGDISINLQITEQQPQEGKDSKSWQDDIDTDMLAEWKRDIEVISDEEYEAMFDPITKDPDWPRFIELQSRRHDFQVVTEEYVQLRRSLESRWPEKMTEIRDRSKES